jgi:hypothetical protein
MTANLPKFTLEFWQPIGNIGLISQFLSFSIPAFGAPHD